jgi:hypothetical protein
VGHQINTGDETWSALERVVSDVQATRVRIARLHADEARLLADAAGIVSAREEERRRQKRTTVHDLAMREVSSELGTAMRLSDRTVQARMSAASTLVNAFAETHRALGDGRIDSAHAAAIVDCGAGISDPSTRAEYERIRLEAASFETPPRLRAIARVVAARIDPELAAELRRRAMAARRIRVIDLDDGMARLLADLPAVLAYAIFDRLTQMAEAERETETAVEAAARAALDARDGAGPDAGGGAGLHPGDSAGSDAGAGPDVGGGAGLDAGGLVGPDAGDGAGSDAGAGPDSAGPAVSDSAAGSCRAVANGESVDPIPEAHRPGDETDRPGGEPHRPGGDTEGAPRLSTGPSVERRSLDELRADIFADLVLTCAPTAHGDGDALAAIRAHVQITIPVLTAAGVGDEPALLTGYGPIDDDMARALAAGAPGWDRVMYHPHSGLPLTVDRYRPSAELRRFLRARDERCRFPGCTRKPARCDVDHTHDHAQGGRTQEGNLAHFCRRHHTLKHASAWRVRQAGGGVLEWTSLTGRRHLDRPPSVVQFVPSSVFARPSRGDAVDDAPF